MSSLMRVVLLSWALLWVGAAAEPAAADHHPAASTASHAAPPAAVPTGAAAGAEADRLVKLFNPDIWALDASGRPVVKILNTFFSPASDVARKVNDSGWFSLLVFLPFLVLPQVLLLYAIFKFRDRGDGRKPATFTGNHTLEVVWTAIPCVALIIVTAPAVQITTWMELPPDDRQRSVVPVEIIGKQFSWKYRYQKEPGLGDHIIGLDIGQCQEPLVIPKGRTVSINLTSEDVNHAWWVPAFGVKRDAIIGRHTNMWFTPDTEGVFKGQCAELCGNDHGKMIISSVVVSPADYATYLDLRRAKDDAELVWLAASGGDAAKLDQAVTAYLAKGDSPMRRLALEYWMAANAASLSRVTLQKGVEKSGVEAAKAKLKAELDATRRAPVVALLNRTVARRQAVSDQARTQEAQP